MKYIKYEVDEHKATITLNRPDALNALSPDMISELRSAYDEAETDDNLQPEQKQCYRDVMSSQQPQQEL